MAVFGSISTVRAQLARLDQFQAGFAYLEEALKPGSAARARLQAMGKSGVGRVELAGGTYVLEEVYRSKVRSQGFFESHRLFADIQVVVEGEELIEVTDIRHLALKEDRAPAKDLLVYHMIEAASVLRMRAGDAAVLFPVDGHMPSLAVTTPSVVRKIVVKVPMT